MPPTDAFDDAEDLDPSAADVTDQDLCALFVTLLRAELTGTRPGAIESTLDAAPAPSRSRMLLCLGDALRDDDLVRWIDADSSRRARAIAIALAIVPPDPAAAQAQLLKPGVDRVRSGDAAAPWPRHCIGNAVLADVAGRE